MRNICVIVCTYNRCTYLPKLLESLKVQTLPSELFCILIVDNNSNDETPDTVKQYQQSMSNLHYVFESEQGLSAARNRALKEGRSPLVAYIDDDAWAEPQWLSSVVDAFGLSDDIVCVGGPVELDWQGNRPSWLPKRFESLFTSVDYGPDERLLSSEYYLVGANIAFRREWLQNQGGFPVRLGRKGLCLLSGEETFVFKNVFLTNKKAFYHPEAKVIHRVTTERKTRKWFFLRLFWDGATQPILDAGTAGPKQIYLRGAYVDLRRCTRFLCEGLWAAVRLNRTECIEAVCRLDQRIGRLYMHMRLALGKEV